MAVPTPIQRGLPAVVKTVTVRSAFAPPLEIDVAEALEPGAEKPTTPREKLMARVQPAVELRGNVGTHVVAPYGDPGPTAWKVNLAWLLGAIFVAGALTAVTLFGVGGEFGRRRVKGAGAKAAGG